MKFAKELERDSVAEWRIKYLNYKAGKKYVKAVSRAINRANGTPLSFARSREPPPRATPTFLGIGSPFTPRRSNNGHGQTSDDSETAAPLRARPAPMGRSPDRQRAARPIPTRGERQDLNSGNQAGLQYGSFVPTPPAVTPPPAHERQNFELPAPAIRVPSHASEPEPPMLSRDATLNRLAVQRSASMAAGIPSAGTAPGIPDLAPSDLMSPRQRFRRLFSVGNFEARQNTNQNDVSLQSFDEVREREKEFFDFLDSELDKVETFYKQKEDQAGRRLDLLRDQLHEMRNRRTQEITEARRRKERGDGIDPHDRTDGKDHERHSLLDPIKSKIFKPGKNSKALQAMPQTPVVVGASGGDGRRDYIRRPTDEDVPYRTAKRKLKLALQEFYRGLELLKSYALLNRTAFRKLNKKYDKAVNARPPYRYMNEKVNRAWFVNSDILEGHIHTVEDLYARYFERGNRKLAAGKLRSLTKQAGDQSGSALISGLLIGTGGVFTIQGLIYGAQLLFDPDPLVRTQTNYLMQLYGGYFLMLYLFIFFCLDCKIWTANKVNYPFIFEFDPRNHLDWRELAQFPSLFLLLFGVFIWLNFTRYGSPSMYIYYPVILIGITLIILFFPAPILGHKSRRWFLYAHWRLFFAGLYPVEFRDFFLGDIYCSLTYATCNIELFFCLYAHDWRNPVQCNSNHSRLLGFFSALPAVWRALQCIRRYHDTKNVFPHLVNCGKYTATILSYVFLSMYRIYGSRTNLALFILFSTINGIYTSIWDLFMDFSLLQPQSRHFLLRDITALKKRWPYYLAMIVDPILRFSWIFYAIFTHDTQHSTIVSFLVGFAEVNRRGMWTLFRVENEHCANVAQYKASRDVPLPYHLEPLVERISTESISGPETSPASQVPTATSTGVSIGGRTPSGHAVPPGAPETVAEGEPVDLETVRRRRLQRTDTLGKKSIARIIAEAHKQDFEKRRKPASTVSGVPVDDEEDLHSDDEDVDDDDNDESSVLDERMDMTEAASLMARGRGSGSDA